jgi:hypothetical protein
MQSEKPREAKKAQENKLFAQPVPQQGVFMATKKREDQSVAAKLSDEVAEGIDSGTYSEFLHQWVENVSAIYDPAANAAQGCAPVMEVVYHNGHVENVQPARSCGEASDRLFEEAIRNSIKPPMPTSFANEVIPLIFYAGMKR